MSKKKRTLDDLLGEALVQEDEQPFKVPNNWVWTEIKHILKPMLNTPPSKLNIETFHYIDVESIDNKKQELRSYKELSTCEAPSRAQRKVVKNDVLISLVRPYLKNIVKINFQDEKLIASTAFYVCSVKQDVNADYLYYYLMSPCATEFLIKNTKGDNSPSVRSGEFELMPIPICAINEQKRIVDKIEILFTKLDKAGQLIDEAKETFELLRATILEKIFNNLNKYQYKIIGEISNVKGGKRLPKGEILVDYDTGFPYIKAGDLKFGTVIPDKIQYLLPETHEKIKNYKVSTNDVYITIVGACIGDVGIIPSDFEGANLTENAAKITNIQGFLPEYLAIWLSSNEAQNEIKQSIASATLGKLSLTKIKELKVPVKTLEEQEQVIKIYKNFMNKKEKVLDLFCSVNLDLLRQSILAKAFTGELGTNDSKDEPAIELLKSILQEK